MSKTVLLSTLGVLLLVPWSLRAETEQLSWVYVPIRIDLNRLQQEVEKAIPSSLSWDEKVNWLGGWAADESTYGSIDRGPLALTAEEDGTLVLSVNWKAVPRWRGRILFSWVTIKSKDCSGTLRLTLKPAIDPRSWKLHLAQCKLEMTVQRAFIPVPGGHLNIRRFVQRLCDQFVAKHQEKVQKAIEAQLPDLHSTVQRFHRVAQQGIQVGRKPPAFLRLVVRRAWLVPPRRQDRNLELAVGLACHLKLTVTDQCPDWKANAPLPPLETSPPKGLRPGFRLLVAVRSDWQPVAEEIEKLRHKPLELKQQGTTISLRLLQAKPTENGTLRLKLQNVRITYPNGNVVHLAQKQPLSVDVALRLDAQRQRLVLEPRPNLPGLSLVTSVLGQWLLKPAHVSFASPLNQARVALEQWAEKTKKQADWELTLQLDTLRLETFELTPSEVQLTGTISGQAQFIIK